jgi:peptidoglycan/xylan/chitin deacetylase (PgdA/CDA1 family)
LRRKSQQRWRNLATREIPPRLAYVVLALLLASGAAASLDVANRLSRLDLSPAPSARRSAPVPRATITSVNLGPRGATISGAAPDGCGVFLFAGGKFLAVTAAAGGAFRFEGVVEEGPFRVGALPLSGAMSLPPPAAARRAVPFAPDLSRGPEAAVAAREILVSFDAGSSDRGAVEILDALRARSIRTTIFLTGEFIRRYPWIARRVASDGHEAGNHTFDHPHLTSYRRNGRQQTLPGVTEAFLRDELSRTASLYRETAGREMAPVWRAPFGEENEEIRGWARAAGYEHVSWTHGPGENLDSMDWVSDETAPGYRSAELVVSRLLALARPGGIILMHLGSDRKEDAVAVRLPELLDSLKARGYRFATAMQFLAERNPAR